MKRAMVLLGLAGLFVMLAVVAAPAPANFQANQPNTTQGPAQFEAGTAATLGVGGFTMKCEEFSKGQWHIQTKFSKIGKGPDGHTKVEQDLTKDGSHQAFSGAYTKCMNALGVVTVNTECEIQVIQLSQTKFDGAVKKQCIIKTSGCELEIEAGNSNFQLVNIEASNVTGGQRAISELTGITVVATSAPCSVLGIKTNKEFTIKQTMIAHSEKVE